MGEKAGEGVSSSSGTVPALADVTAAVESAAGIIQRSSKEADGAKEGEPGPDGKRQRGTGGGKVDKDKTNA